MKASEVRSIVGLGLTIAVVLIAGGKLLHTIGDSQKSIQANTLAIQVHTMEIAKLDTLDAVDYAEDVAYREQNTLQHTEIKSTMKEMSGDIKTLLTRSTP